jgi:uncharacterized surface protein with fasciclin (FAS1) repeats
MSDNSTTLQKTPKTSKNLIETIAGEEKFSTFSRIMGSSHANEIFRTDRDFTVLAPTNAAFDKVPEAQMNKLLNQENQLDLKALLSYHVLPGKKWAANMASSKSSTTVTGEQVSVTDEGGIKINGAALQDRNIEASNGVIHAIDTVLTRPSPVNAPVL